MVNDSMKRYKTSLVSLERQIRTTMRKFFTPTSRLKKKKKSLTIISVGKETEIRTLIDYR